MKGLSSNPELEWEMFGALNNMKTQLYALKL